MYIYLYMHVYLYTFLYIYSGSLSDISSGILSGGYGPAAPTAIGCFRLRSGPTHCDHELARREEHEEKKKMEEEKQHLIKSNNPHLAGGETHVCAHVSSSDTSGTGMSTMIPASKGRRRPAFHTREPTCFFTSFAAKEIKGQASETSILRCCNQCISNRLQ